MSFLANLFVALVALLHVYFLVLEMFLWTKPVGLATFRQSLAKAQESAVLAANQGLYNGFLAAGLIWGLWTDQFAVKMFFLICVVIAGIYGGITARRTILYVQALPGLLALLLLYFSR